MRRLILLSLLLFVACDDADSTAEALTDQGIGADSGPSGPDAALNGCGQIPCIAVSDCDPIQPDFCALPWPSNKFLQPANDRDTGFSLQFGATTLPASHQGVHISPAAFQRMDGYGVGINLIVLFPNLDATPLPNELDIEASLAPTANILLFEAGDDGLTRIPYFVDLDLRETDPLRRSLLIRPAVLLHENTRYVVALRDLIDREGAPIERSLAFQALVIGEGALHPGLADRVATFESLFADLETVGISRDQLTLAWDFHTASHQALHGDLLQMRDEALETVGVEGPELTFTEIVELTPEENADIAFEIQGTARVPHYMRESGPFLGYTGWEINRGVDDAPAQNGWRETPFWLRIPRSALGGPPQALLEYGHGLNGTGAQCKSGHLGALANREGVIIFAGNMVGMSSEDVPGIVTLINDLSWFPWLADRLHQGLVDYLLIARGMKGRLAQMPWILDHNIQIDGEQLYYTGDSQGGIYGASVLALSTDTTRGVLGVPGQNYSTLLTRSVDFEPFLLVLGGAYPESLQQAVALAAIQVLWDRTDPSSHYYHLSADPHENTPPHRMIGATAKGDYQVPLVTMEIAARSATDLVLTDNYDDSREVELVPSVGYPIEGSALVNWHFGNGWPAVGNLPPVEDAFGDPHGSPRKERAYQDQMMHFFRTGVIIDVCNGGLCPPEQ